MQRFEMADAREGGLQVTLEIPFEKAESPAQQRAMIG
jgi:hypothetical protein